MEKLFKNSLRYLMMLACVMTLGLAATSCGDDEDDDEPSGSSSIVGKWVFEGNVDGDYVTTTLEFLSNGKANIEENYRDYPEDNYKVTVSYSVSGNLSSGATLNMTGKTVDGDSYNQSYIATISGKKLTLVGKGGEADGERIVLTKK